MHYPVMTERQLAARWKFSLKTVRRWRSDGEVPVWHKLLQHVRYHDPGQLDHAAIVPPVGGGPATASVRPGSTTCGAQAAEVARRTNPPALICRIGVPAKPSTVGTARTRTRTLRAMAPEWFRKVPFPAP